MKSIIIFILISFSFSQNIRKTDSLISVTITEIDNYKSYCSSTYNNDTNYIRVKSDVDTTIISNVTGLVLKMNDETFELECLLDIVQNMRSLLRCHYNGEFSVTGDVYLSSSGDIVVGDGTVATLTLKRDLLFEYYTPKFAELIPTDTINIDFNSASEQDISLTFDTTIDYDIKFAAKLESYEYSKLEYLACTTSDNTATCKLTKEMFSSYEDETFEILHLKKCNSVYYFESKQYFYINKTSTEGITFTADYIFRNSNKCQKTIKKNTSIIFNTSSNFGLEEETHIDGFFISLANDEFMKCKIAKDSNPNVTCVYENRDIYSPFQDGNFFLQARKEKIIFEGNTLVYNRTKIIPNYNDNHNELIYYPETFTVNFTDNESEVFTFDIEFESAVKFTFYVSEEKEKTEGEKELEVDIEETNVTVEVTSDVFVPAENDKIYYVNYVDACGNSITTTAVTVIGNPTPPTPSASGFIKMSVYTLLLIGLILF